MSESSEILLDEMAKCDLSDDSIDQIREKVKIGKDPVVIFAFSQLLLIKAFDDSVQSDTSSENLTNSSSTSVVSNVNKSEHEFISQSAKQKVLIREAVHWLSQLSAKGYCEAQYLLGDAYSSGILGKTVSLKAFNLFLVAAKHGHVESAYRVACCYENGIGCGRDAQKAIKYLTIAATRNHPSAMFKLGLYAFHGKMGFGSEPQTKIKGIKWLSLAAKNANLLTNAAPYELAKIYENGFIDVIISDKRYAFELYCKAAALEHPRSCAIVGKLYETGDKHHGVEANADLSIRYYTVGAEAEDLESMLGLCAWYFIGNDILPKDLEKAYFWANKAAVAGHPKAQFTMSFFLENGHGCTIDKSTSLKWLQAAAISGYPRAVEKLAKLNAKDSSGSSTPSQSITKSKSKNSFKRLSSLSFYKAKA